LEVMQNTCMRLLIVLAVVACASGSLLPPTTTEANPCFPLTRAWGSGPNGVSLKDWWCGADDLYGFLGFSYPMEDDNCGAYSYNNFLNDFKNMKSRFNSTFVRAYLPTCTSTTLWVNMIKAARDTSLAIIPMIFWDWQQNDPVMTAAENGFLGVFNNSEVGSIAPYIVHSVAFGDELGEQGTYWLSRMTTFKTKLAKYSVPLTMTDDWDRSVYKSGTGLSSFGKQVNDLSDLTQAHVMPFYHPDPCPDAYHFWPYFTQQLQFLVANNKRPIFISQTLWAYNRNSHSRGSHDEADNMDNYQEYWNTINNNCQTFKSMKIAWFIHTYKGEDGLDMVKNDGTPVFNFKPARC